MAELPDPTSSIEPPNLSTGTLARFGAQSRLIAAAGAGIACHVLGDRLCPHDPALSRQVPGHGDEGLAGRPSATNNGFMTKHGEVER